MISFIEEKELLYQAQYGFRKSHSTQHVVLDIINTIQAKMDKRLFSCGIFINLKKAFDTVNHGILLNKLEHFGSRGIINDWFSSYLKNRMQTTELKCHILRRLQLPVACLKGLSWDHSFFYYMQMTYRTPRTNSISTSLLMIQISFMPTKILNLWKPLKTVNFVRCVTG